MRKMLPILALCLSLCLLAGCAGTPVVYYSDCTCPAGSHEEVAVAPTEYVPTVEGAVKTGLALNAAVAGTKNAGEAEDGKYTVTMTVTMAAVLVDEDGVIQSCAIDDLGTSVTFDEKGQITSDLSVPRTKNEQGSDYGMVAWGGAVAEWNEQAAALAAYACGKTIDELKNGDIDESGYAKEGTDLATSATISLGGYVSAIEKAVNNAKHLGAQAGDQLKLASVSDLSSSVSVTAEADGCAQLDTTVTALTVQGDIFTSCAIDAVQAKAAFNTEGVIGDVDTTVATKNELGADYGMVAWGGAIAEWDAQAAAFASYVTGKTAEEVLGIAVDESTHPQEADLATSVTIAIGGFQNLIVKAVQG